MNKYAPEIVRKTRTQPMALATIKALEKLKIFRHNLFLKYTKREIVFKTVNPIPKHEQTYDLMPIFYEGGLSRNTWAVFGFFFFGYIAYWAARFTYDQDLRYYYYIRFPYEMHAVDEQTAILNKKYKEFKSKLPFGGEFPDLTQPENFNRFRRELKEYLFNTSEKQELIKQVEAEVKKDSKEFDSSIKDITTYLNEQDKKLQKIKVE